MNSQSTRQLRTGRNMPVLGLGTWKLTDQTTAFIVAALDMGYKLIDTSGDYSTQPEIGEALEQSGVKRSDYYIVTKVEETDDAYQATKQNLKELRLDYADLVLIHRPPESGAGHDLWRGLIRAKQEGLARDIGVSNYSASQIDELIGASDEAPVVNQIEWSPFGHSLEMLSYCQQRGIIIQAYSPITRAERLSNELLQDIADYHGKSPAQILIRWSLQIGSVPLPKANDPRHLEENIDVFDFELSKNDMSALSDLNEHYSALGSLPYVPESAQA